MEDGQCKKHTIVENCVIYDDTSDNCNECEYGYGYGLNNNNMCQALVFGIPGCESYDSASDGSKCSVCDDDSFLDSRGNC